MMTSKGSWKLGASRSTTKLRPVGGVERFRPTSFTPPAASKEVIAAASMKKRLSPARHESKDLSDVGTLPGFGGSKYMIHAANSTDVDTFPMPQAVRRSPRLAEATAGARADTNAIKGIVDVATSGLLNSSFASESATTPADNSVDTNGTNGESATTPADDGVASLRKKNLDSPAAGHDDSAPMGDVGLDSDMSSFCDFSVMDSPPVHVSTITSYANGDCPSTLVKKMAASGKLKGRGGGKKVLSAAEKEAMEMAAAFVVEQEGIRAAETVATVTKDAVNARDSSRVGCNNVSVDRGSSTAAAVSRTNSARRGYTSATNASRRGGGLPWNSLKSAMVAANGPVVARRQPVSVGIGAPEPDVAPETADGGKHRIMARGSPSRLQQEQRLKQAGGARRMFDAGLSHPRGQQQQEQKPQGSSTGRKSLTMPQMPNFRTTQHAERYNKPVETTEQAEIRKQREMQKELMHMTRRNQLGLERNRRTRFIGNVHSSKPLTVLEGPAMKTAGRLGEKTYAVVGPNGPTVPEPFGLSQSNRPNKADIENKAPDRLHTKPAGDHAKAKACPSSPFNPKPTQSRSSRLRTEASAAVHVPRPNVLTPAEREEAELAEMKKHQFKARSYNAGSIGIGREGAVFKPRHSDKPPTQQAPFRLSTDARATKSFPSPYRSRDEEEMSKPFKARPMPSPRRQLVSAGPGRKLVTLTEARPFHLRSEERGRAKQAILAQKLLIQQNHDEAAMKIRARPLPAPSKGFAPRRSERPLTETKFRLSSQARHERAEFEFMGRINRDEEQARRASEVHALPLPVATFKPYPRRTRVPHTQPVEMMLHSTARAEERGRWDTEKNARLDAAERQRREVKEASAAEEQRAIAELRRRPSDEGGMAFKAKPITRSSAPPEGPRMPMTARVYDSENRLIATWLMHPESP